MKLLSLLFLILMFGSCASYDKKDHCEENKLTDGQECLESWEKYKSNRRDEMWDIIDRPGFDR